MSGDPRPDRCATCTYWDSKGRCHRRPPWVLAHGETAWPETPAHESCGEHAMVAPPTTTAREQHLAKELTAAGLRLGLIADAIKDHLGSARLLAMAETGKQRALTEARPHG
jgi:hypothetical protein